MNEVASLHLYVDMALIWIIKLGQALYHHYHRVLGKKDVAWYAMAKESGCVLYHRCGQSYATSSIDNRIAFTRACIE